MRTTSDTDEHPTDSAGRVDVVGRHKGLVRRTALIAVFTLASRILGLVRETLSASIFGDRSAINDAFVTAWRVPNMFRALMVEGAITTSMQQAMTRADHERGEEGGRALFHAMLRVVVLSAIAVTAVGGAIVWFLPDTMPFTGWAWLGADPGPVRELTARLMPFLVFLVAAAVAGGALQVRGHFVAPAFAPVAMNAVWIGALLYAAYEYGWGGPSGETPEARFTRHFEMARLLATLVLVAGAVLFLANVPPLARCRLGWGSDARTPRVGVAEVWPILRSTLPLAFGAAVYQVNALITGFLAEGLLPDGGPTALYYAARLQQLPLSLVAAAATSAVFPSLVALGQVGNKKELKRLHDDTHFAVAFVAVPATLGLLVFAEPVCAACFGHGAFGSEGVERTAAALRWLTLAILPAGATGLMARAHYAIGDYATPVKCAVAMLLLNTVLAVTLTAGFHMDADGLALATAITTWGNLALLGPQLRRRLGRLEAQPLTGRARPASRLGRIVLASGLAVGLAVVVHGLFGSGSHPIVALGTAIAVALGAYTVCALLLRIQEAERMIQRWRRV